MMSNQPAEAYHCRRYLINCFIHPAVAALFTTWEQVKRFENSGYSTEDLLNVQVGRLINDVYVVSNFFGGDVNSEDIA
jgi:hypothetical protein